MAARLRTALRAGRHAAVATRGARTRGPAIRDGTGRRTAADRTAAAASRGRVALPRREADRLRPLVQQAEVPRRLPTGPQLPRRDRLPRLDRRPRRLVGHQGAAQGLERLQPDVGRRPGLLPVRDRPTTLFAYDTKSKGVRRVLDPGDADIKSASACADAIVYDRFGTLHPFDLKTEKSRPIPVRVAADLPGVRPQVEKAAKNVRKAGLSPTGTRAGSGEGTRLAGG
jgi:hypothetical protein